MKTNILFYSWSDAFFTPTVLNRATNFLSVCNCVDISLITSTSIWLRRFSKSTFSIFRTLIRENGILTSMITVLSGNHRALHGLLRIAVLTSLLNEFLIYFNLINFLNDGLIGILDDTDMSFFVHEWLSALKPFHEIVVFLSLFLVQNVTDSWVLISFRFNQKVFLLLKTWLFDLHKIEIWIVSVVNGIVLTQLISLPSYKRLVLIVVILYINFLYFLNAFVSFPFWTAYFFALVFRVRQRFLAILSFALSQRFIGIHGFMGG